MEDIITAMSGLIISFIIGIFLKRTFSSVKKPNYKSGGITSLNTILAFSIVAVIALITRNTLLIILTSLLAYLVSKGEYLANEHYIYQLAMSIFIGLLGPYISYTIREYIQERNIISNESDYTEIPYEVTELDNRAEAEEVAPELSLETPDEIEVDDFEFEDI